MPSSGTFRRVAHVRSDVAEKRIPSIKVKRVFLPNVSSVRRELGLYIPEDDIFHSLLRLLERTINLCIVSDECRP
jgi:hypothetical protein